MNKWLQWIQTMPTNLVFYDDLCNKPYAVVEKPIAFKFGYIFWTNIIFSGQHREIWRPDTVSADGTTATLFKIETLGKDAYKRSIPLKRPPLEATEEFPVVRAKKRPCVFVQMINNHPSNPMCQVIPMYSVQDDMAKLKRGYNQNVIDEARSFQHSNLFYLPIDEIKTLKNSMLRLEETQFIYRNALEYCNCRLSDEIRQYLYEHITMFFAKTYNPDSMYAEILKENNLI